MSLNYHSKAKPFTYQSQIWADKAGYNIYLPLVLLYNNDASLLPDSIVFKTGKGFFIDSSKNQVITKYTCGVAMLQVPFFAVAHLITKITGGESNGFSLYYQKAIDFAGVFYCVLGLVLLWEIGKVRFKNSFFFLAILATLFGSNLLYYSIDETGMSHIYSFFLFSLYLYLLIKSNFLKKKNAKWTFFLGLTMSLILLIRPINILFLISYFFWNLSIDSTLKERIIRIVQPQTLLVLIFCLFIVWIPQLMYWKVTFGKWLVYSYGNESFDFLHPKLWIVWFSAKQSAFIYGIIILLPIMWMLYRCLYLSKNNLFYLFIFVAISYVTACWHDPAFGCSFGMRNLVEYQALFIFPLAKLFSFYANKTIISKALFISTVLIVITFNIVLVYSYGGCSVISNHLSYWEIIEMVN